MARQQQESRTATVREELAQRIERGAWRPREQLPAEPELAASLGVSRATLRDALRSLEEDGFVTRIRGAGTFVTFRPRLKNNLDVNFGVSDLIRSMGMRPGAKTTRTYRRTATPDEAVGLTVPADSPVMCLERVRTADARPVVFSIDVIPASFVDAHPHALPRLGQGSIYAFLEEELGLSVRQGVASIRPQNADRALAERLDVPEGTLVLYLLQVDYDTQGRAILLSHEHHLADAFEITVVRRGPGPRTKEPS
jgi:DNA-binding GntR family transcriptional regulator